MGGGDDTLNITGGVASITGDISGGAGSNSVTFSPGSNQSFSYSGSISNFSSAEIKSGIVTLAGASTYTGDTTISGGKLVAHNTSGSATDTGNITVQNNAILSGDGRIGGDVSLESGGVIAPGVTQGELRLGGNLAITDGSRFVFELGPSSDLLTIAGGLNFFGSGKAIFDIVDKGIVADGDYTLVTFATSSGLTMDNLGFGNTPAGFSGTLNLTSDSIILHVDSVPEPSSPALTGMAGLALVCFLVWRKRRIA